MSGLLWGAMEPLAAAPVLSGKAQIDGALGKVRVKGAGHREPLYRDRMATAGVTCYDCHGDMLAVGEDFPKNFLAHQDKLGSTERDDYRVPWFDEPDCGSCHIGDGNRGKGGGGGFFSEGVLKTAFDPNDWSATTRPIDRNDFNAKHFAVAPKENFKASFPTDFYYDLVQETDDWLVKTVDTKIDAPVYRFGKDTHGNVTCGACHGAAHGIWPNRDPSANDNVTAKKEDLDGGQYSGDPKPGILGVRTTCIRSTTPTGGKKRRGTRPTGMALPPAAGITTTPSCPERKGKTSARPATATTTRGRGCRRRRWTGCSTSAASIPRSSNELDSSPRSSGSPPAPRSAATPATAWRPASSAYRDIDGGGDSPLESTPGRASCHF
ncbi:MAG TPA: hypothetical protein VNL74_07965 [Methylococcus sp.]|nr:hypothetical protein [Methylococcus sp.]